MSPRRFFFRAGAAIWIAGGVGHFVLVDVLTLHGRIRVSEFSCFGALRSGKRPLTRPGPHLKSCVKMLSYVRFRKR